ncbi:hypothetical protein OH733_21715 [Streptomyces griseus]|uniref:Secreted protein n=1 Tax=Streptomyces sp. CMC78 TaxID=3231512 RepID=A0AB33KFX0_9ACTN|nr:hypothetical protein [Streptomyces sp. ID01-9D]MDX5573875.1 hypothetical protein [Streptomyces sp. ID01-9D]WTC89191.1 hypothetical protein OH733_21715 [Streptomyces griseus]WTD68182.1 hypothetical protein OH763_15270 [Streptomyces griseus]
MTRTKFVAAALLTVALAVPTATAVAADAYGGGAHAWSPADGGKSGKIAVKDNSKDGDPVKAEYYRTSSSETKRTLWNHSGRGTTAYSGDGSRIYKFKACDENYGSPDDCSGWVIP